MIYQIQYGVAVISCNTAPAVAEVIDALRHIAAPVESGVVAMELTPKVLKLQDPAEQIPDLRRFVHGTNQERYLDLMASLAVGEGLMLDAIWSHLKLRSVKELNGALMEGLRSP